MSIFSHLMSGSEPDPDDEPGAVSPDVSWPEAQGVSSRYDAGPEEAVSPWEAGFENLSGFLPGQWRETRPEDDAGQAPAAGRTGDGALAGARQKAADRTRGLASEFRDPQPETFRQHRRHIAGHPLRPEGKWEGAVFVTAYGSVTFPVKGTGKGMVRAGNALREAGIRVDWAGDRFARVGTVIVFLAIVIVVILIIS